MLLFLSLSVLLLAQGATATLRGVNIGGWLLLEKWMTPSLFAQFGDDGACDEWSFCQSLGYNGAQQQLAQHWGSFFTESDVAALQATGINALRIPIGYWAFKQYDDEPYVTGAAEYLDQALEWARAYGMKVWVDLHGAPGSQNGFDNSGHEPVVAWQTASNLGRSYEVLNLMSMRYGTAAYTDVVVGIELVNEPISWGNNDFGVTWDFYENARSKARSLAGNSALGIVMHDSFVGPAAFTAMADGGTVIDTHIYQLYTDADNSLDQPGHIAKACGMASSLASTNAQIPVVVGEWTAGTNVCSDEYGNTWAGTSTSSAGCSCVNDAASEWSDALVTQMRRYVEAQLDVWESSTSGYFFWNFKTESDNPWNYMAASGRGIIPNPITSRAYPGQCGFTPDLGAGSSDTANTTAAASATATVTAVLTATPVATSAGSAAASTPTPALRARRVKRGHLGR